MKKKIKKAAAITYDKDQQIPTVIAKGKGVVAEKILERAEKLKLPLYKDSNIADELTQMDIGDQIPPELYEVIAEILLFVDDLDKLEAKINAKK